MPKVFLSYSRKDETLVEELYRRLTRDGVDCFRDIESIEWGKNIVDELEKGIDESDIFVPILSPDYCNSEWANRERTSAMFDGPEGQKHRLLPLLRQPCKKLPRFLRPLKHIDVTTDALFKKHYPKICRDLVLTCESKAFNCKMSVWQDRQR